MSNNNFYANMAANSAQHTQEMLRTMDRVSSVPSSLQELLQRDVKVEEDAPCQVLVALSAILEASRENNEMLSRIEENTRRTAEATERIAQCLGNLDAKTSRQFFEELSAYAAKND